VITSAIANTRMKVGACHNRFCHRTTPQSEGKQCNDRLIKSTHFIPFRVRQSTELLADKCMRKIVRLHGVPVSIVSDIDTRFRSHFWESLQENLGTRLKFSISYHAETDGQSERTIQILKDMLRACIIDFKGSWEAYLHLAEFFYNNSYHASIKMAPFEALYG